MDILPIAQHGLYEKQTSTLADRIRKVDMERPQAVPIDPPAPPDADDIPNDELRDGDGPALQDATKKDGRVRGVIRLLEAGHFKGVADVRLRINFFDELSQRAAVASRPVVEEQSAILQSGMSARMDELADTLAIDDEARDAIGESVEEFAVSVQAAVDEGEGGPRLDMDAVSDSIRSAFDALVDNVRALLTPPDEALEVVDEPPADSRIDPKDVPEDPNTDPRTPAEEPVDEPAVPVDDAIAALRDGFEEALAAFIGSINEAMQLPDPTLPSGRGVAFEKFLAIYNDLRGLTPSVDARI